MTDKPLPKRLQPALKALEKDLLERAKLPNVEAGLKAAWAAETQIAETGQNFDPWRKARVTQIAVAWVLSMVFVRTLEDRGLIDPRIAGPDAPRQAIARDRDAAFTQIAPFLGPREYLLAVFQELSHLPGAREVFDARHNPVWVLSPSGEGARALLDFFQQVDAETGAPVFTFTGTDTRFLGDLYQDLSEAVRKRYALLQTPDFVEKFILEQTLHPAVAEFGLAEVRLIDPTCGSGHFLLGAFRDLLAAWQRQEPATPIEELARRALGQVYGVDINPYAVAIARFRLVLAVLEAVGISRLDRAPVLRPKVVVADSLLHRLKDQKRLSQELPMEEWPSWGDGLFRLSEPGIVAEVLGQRYHAVVGNPPYITEKDSTKRNKYREMYESAAGLYTLAAPFTERFFDLAVNGGFVGLINSNAWSKRDYGKTLIERVLPRLDVHKIIDTSGCYLPGHGTPTLLLFGRNQPPGAQAVMAVLGKRGEREIPSNPSAAPVWSEIVSHHNTLGYDGVYVSTEGIAQSEMRHHPWILIGGGSRSLFTRLKENSAYELGELSDSVGPMCMTKQDEAFVAPMGIHRSRGIEPTFIRPFFTGQDVREWRLESRNGIVFPYDDHIELRNLEQQAYQYLWPSKPILEARKVFGGNSYRQARRAWWAFGQIPVERSCRPYSLAFAFVSTHNNFVMHRRGSVLNQHAPIITLAANFTESDHKALLGYLNSSTVGFWCRLVMFPKGGDQVGDGARLSKIPWQDRLEYASNLLQQLPVPTIESLQESLLELVKAAENVVRLQGDISFEKVVSITLSTTPTLDALREARAQAMSEHARLRGILVSLQEEMDWRIYGLFGLPTVLAQSLDEICVPVDPNHRPFEVRLAREVEADISASEWFRIHKREAPGDVGGPLENLYRQRLRLLDDLEHGRELRMLETPEAKRRWSSTEDEKAFQSAVRIWLLERIETAFREQATPELRTARLIAADIGRDPSVQAAHELLTEDSGLDLVRLLSLLSDDEGVPFLSGWRYCESGMEKRAGWEESWRLQCLEEQSELDPELSRLGLKAMPVPDKYANKDFLRHYWSMRGKLDVPKERFVTVPGGTTDDDPTPLVGWAGWDHLQTAQALAALYQRRKAEDGWSGERLLPLLAGIAERVPWLLQWHNNPAEAFGGIRLGNFFKDFVAGESQALGVSSEDLRTWTPPSAPRRTTLDADEVYAALQKWTPEIDDDAEDEDAETPEGPTADELATEVGAKKTLVNRALKKLMLEGRVEKLEGRPARFIATGDET